MKKIYLLLVSCFFLQSGKITFGQNVGTYKFSNTKGIYIPSLLGKTITTTSWDEEIYTDQEIGFPFLYRGQIYTRYTLYCNGYITLGSGINSLSVSNPLSGSSNSISVFGMDLKNSDADIFNPDNRVSDINIFNFGNAGDKKCVIQFRSFSKSTGPDDVTGNAQIVIYEKNGRIDFNYGLFNGSFPTSDVEVGLSGSGDFKNLKGADWKNPVAGTLIGDKMSATGTQAGSTLPDTGRVYSFMPDTALKPAAPGNITFSDIALQTITVNWQDNSTNENNFAVYYSEDGQNYVYSGSTVASSTSTGTGAGYSRTITALDPGTNYTFKIFAISEGGFSDPLIGEETTTQPSFPLAVSIPATQYPSITAALDSINKYGLTGNTIITLLSTYVSTVEPSFPVNIPMLPGSNDNSITIRPDADATGLSITSTSSQTIRMNGCKNIIFDGRKGGAGSTDLTIQNNSTSSNVILFEEGANNNTFKYCMIRGTNNSISSGLVYFGSSSTGSGNSYNTISNCDIHEGTSTPVNLIYCTGSSSAVNSYNKILNNNLYNFWSNTQNATGILVSENNNNYTISGNSFYQTTSRNTATTNLTLTGIAIEAPEKGLNFLIDSNFIGGTAPYNGGTALILGSSANITYNFRGIYLKNAAYIIPLTVISRNVISNLDISSTPSFLSLAGTIFSGIETGAGCAVISGNMIGSNSIINSIKINSSKAATIEGITYTGDGDAAGIISGNQVGGIEILMNGTVGHNFAGIAMYGGINTILNNKIGSETTANSIYNKSSGNLYPVNYGIYTFYGTNTITGNIIANITCDNTSSTATMAGIRTTTTATVALINENKIFNLSSSSASTSFNTTPAMAGIVVNNALIGLTVEHNTIYNLIAANGGNIANTVSGIIGLSSTQTNFKRNIVHSLNNLSLNSGASIIGIGNYSDKFKCENSVIRLGLDADGNDVSKGHLKIYGLLDNNSNSGTSSSYQFNTVYIGGTNVLTGSSNTAAFLREPNSVDSVFLANNIFINNRNNGTSSGKHYAMLVNNNNLLTSNYNIYNAPNTGGFMFGKTDATAANYSNIPAWTAYATAQDSNSLAGDPGFNSSNAAWDVDGQSNLKLTVGTIADETGFSFSMDSVASDFEMDQRAGNTPTDIGADAGVFSCTNFVAEVYSLVNKGCEGDSILLSGNIGSGFTYQWLKNNSLISGATGAFYKAFASGDYSVIVTTDLLCKDTSISKTITIESLPVANIAAAGAIIFCTGGSIVLSADTASGNTYRWHLNGSMLFTLGSTSPSYTAKNEGYYNVKVTNATGCFQFSDSLLVTVNEKPTAVVTTSGNSLCAGDSMDLYSSPGIMYQWNFDNNTVIGAAAEKFSAKDSGSYSVTVYSNENCSATSAPVFINVYPYPSVTITAIPSLSVCEGDSIYLVGGGASTYLWSTGATTKAIGFTAGGTYSVTGTLNGCSAASVPVVALVNALPAKPVITTAGDSLISTSSAGYQWYKSGVPVLSGNQQVLFPQITGYYTVTVTDGNGCKNTSDSVYFIVTGVFDIFEITKPLFSPNPVHGEGVLNYRVVNNSNVEIDIYDLSGRKISKLFNGQQGTGNYSIKVNSMELGLNNGVYFLRINNSGVTHNIKVVVAE